MIELVERYFSRGDEQPERCSEQSKCYAEKKVSDLPLTMNRKKATTPTKIQAQGKEIKAKKNPQKAYLMSSPAFFSAKKR